MSMDDASVNNWTGGLIGMKNGQLTGGFWTRMVDEAVGEVTGRNAARKALMMQQDAIDAAKAQQQAEIDNANAQKQAADLSASQAAGALRDKATNSFNMSQGATPDQALTKDFLGL